MFWVERYINHLFLKIKMEKDKLDLIKKIITLVDTKEGLKKVENAVDEVLRTQWDKEAKDRVSLKNGERIKTNKILTLYLTIYLFKMKYGRGSVTCHALSNLYISWR